MPFQFYVLVCTDQGLFMQFALHGWDSAFFGIDLHMTVLMHLAVS